MDSTIAALLVLAALVYGIFGWRLIHHLAVMDALALAFFLSQVLYHADRSPTGYYYTMPLGLLVLFGLPWLAWRYPKQAVYAMAGFVGFAIVQILFLQEGDPLLARLLLGAVGAGFAMALQMSLSNQTAIVVTALHGGWLAVAAMEVLAQSPQTFFSRLFNSLNSTSVMLVPAIILVLAAIMTTIQWSDMERTTDPY